MVNSDFEKDLRSIGNLNQVVHTPARLMTLLLLQQVSTVDFIQLMKYTDLTWGNLSTHLSKLEDAGYVMITKTFKGKRPQTLISLTDSGRQAYTQWGHTIIKALPSVISRQYFPQLEKSDKVPQVAIYSDESDLAVASAKDIFFLPRYHRWSMDLPPIKEYSPLI